MNVLHSVMHGMEWRNEVERKGWKMLVWYGFEWMHRAWMNGVDAKDMKLSLLREAYPIILMPIVYHYVHPRSIEYAGT